MKCYDYSWEQFQENSWEAIPLHDVSEVEGPDGQPEGTEMKDYQVNHLRPTAVSCSYVVRPTMGAQANMINNQSDMI